MKRHLIHSTKPPKTRRPNKEIKNIFPGQKSKRQFQQQLHALTLVHTLTHPFSLAFHTHTQLHTYTHSHARTHMCVLGAIQTFLQLRKDRRHLFFLFRVVIFYFIPLSSKKIVASQKVIFYLIPIFQEQELGIITASQWGCIICKHTARWLYLSQMKNVLFCSNKNVFEKWKNAAG